VFLYKFRKDNESSIGEIYIKNKRRAQRDARFKKFFPQGETRESVAGAIPPLPEFAIYSFRETKFTGKVFAQKNKRRATRDARFKKLFPQGETRESVAGAIHHLPEFAIYSFRETKFTGKVFAQKNKHRATRDARFKKLFPQGETRESAAGATPNPRQTPICK
ncbi:MAG: hypothetical protein IJI37_07165, partial [Opitutales bacterium]|nr:hypothetical protein [Opitutales bacterium]